MSYDLPDDGDMIDDVAEAIRDIQGAWLRSVREVVAKDRADAKEARERADRAEAMLRKHAAYPAIEEARALRDEVDRLRRIVAKDVMYQTPGPRPGWVLTPGGYARVDVRRFGEVELSRRGGWTWYLDGGPTAGGTRYLTAADAIDACEAAIAAGGEP